MRRPRIWWTEDEVSKVVDAAVRAYLTDPELTVTALFEAAQEGMPEERKREITAFAAVPNILQAIKVRLSVLRAVYEQGGGEAAKARQEQEQQEREQLAEQLREAQERIAALEAQNQQLHGQLQNVPGAAQILANTPTEALFFLVLQRFVGAFKGEREDMQTFLATFVATRLSGERHALENRMGNIERLLADLSKSGHIVNGPAMPAGQENAYMPDFVIAGLKRQDFQRLQVALSKSNLRLKNLDVSIPSKISVPANHDRFFVWMQGLAGDLGETLANRSKRAVVVRGTVNDLQAVILKAAEEVRKEKQNADSA